jgi:hypothetical protein
VLLDRQVIELEFLEGLQRAALGVLVFDDRVGR